MIGLLPLGKIIAAIAVFYAAVMIVLIYFTESRSLSVFDSVVFMTSGFASVSFVVWLMLNFGWRLLWVKIPKLNSWIFPDLEGEWDMRIDWSVEDRSGTKQARATVKQSLLKISMDVESEDSDSETIAATPKRDPLSERPILFYAFEVTPHDDGTDSSMPYKGMAILKLGQADLNQLSGNYFTDRQTKGRFSLTRRN